MPPKAQNIHVPQDELNKLSASVVHLTQYIDDNRATLIPNTPQFQFPESHTAHSTAVSSSLLKLALFTKKYTIAPYKAAQLDQLLSALIPSLPLRYIVFYPVNIRNLLLDLTEFLISSSADFAIKAVTKFHFLYTCGEALAGIDNQLFRGSYWHYATHCYRFTQERGMMPHTGYPNTVLDLDPQLFKQPNEYRALWVQLSAAALRDVTLFFQKPTAETVQSVNPADPKSIEWRHIVYTIDIIVSLAMNSRLLHIYVPEDDFLTSISFLSTLRNVATTVGLLLATLQELLNELNGNTGCVGAVLNKQQQVQLQQLPLMLSKLYQVFISIFSPSDLEDQDEFDELKKQMKKLSLTNKSATGKHPIVPIQATDAQRANFQKVAKGEFLSNLAPMVIQDMILLISNPQLQSDIFFLLLLVVEMSFDHMVYFSLGHLPTQNSPSPTKSTGLSTIIRILSQRFTDKTIPAPFSTTLKSSHTVASSHFLLTNEELVQFCCCMLDLIVTVLQQSTSPQQIDYSVPIRQLMVNAGIFTVIITFSAQLAGELAYIRAKQTHSTSTAKGKKMVGVNAIELQFIPSFIITNRLFYIFASLFNFSHQLLVSAYTPSSNTLTDPQIASLAAFLTPFVTTQHSQYQQALSTLFQLFNPSDVRDPDIFDNNETCDSLYCFLIHLQLYEHLLHFSSATRPFGTLADCKKEEIANFISTSLKNTQSTIVTASTLLDQYENANPVKLDTKTADLYTRLTQRNMTILSMVDTQISHAPDTKYTASDVFAQCGVLLSHCQSSTLPGLISLYLQTYAVVDNPPTSTLLPRAQPVEAFLSNLVNKTLHVDAVLQQNKEQLFDVGFEEDMSGPQPNSIPEEQDEDDEDGELASGGFSFGGNDFVA